MAAKKPSALTAALSGAPGSEAPVHHHAPLKKSFLDPAAFPCLAYAAQVEGIESVPLGDVPEEDLGLALPDKIVVGSIPVDFPVGSKLVDYELNPRRRRGGEEVVPDAAESFGGPSSVTANYMSQAIIGSLPKGLTQDAKAKIQASVPASPSAAALKELSAASVTARNALGKKLRRQVISGAVVVFITAGYSGKRFIFEKAKQLGVKSIVVDGPDSWVQMLETEGLIEKFIPVDFSDAETVFDRCLEAIKKASKEVGDLDGITTFCELAVPLTSRLAEVLGLPHNSVEAVDNARDKHATRAIMEKAGLPTPRHYKICRPEDVPIAGEHVGFPAVIKPISGAASIGVIRVNNATELDAAYKRVVSDMSKCRIVAGALLEGDGGDDVGNAGTWIQLVLMLEEYLDGPEVDCDLVFDNGVPVFGAITDNWPTVEPYFNETGSNCPSILPTYQQQELLELSVRAVQCLGFKLGVFHVESKYTSRGARLIEVNCRMGGGPVRNTNLLVWGVDLVEEHLMASAGIPVRPPIPKKPLKEIAEYTVNAEVSGILQNTDFLDKWQDNPDVIYAKPIIKAGQKCVCVKDGLPTWICELMVCKPTVKEAIDFVNAITASLDVPIV